VVLLNILQTLLSLVNELIHYDVSTALDKIDTRDQVTSYRTVVSFESELLRDFSLCILQKNNIFECSAEIPELPVVKPMSTWRGKDVTTDVARGIMIGHLEGAGGSLEVREFWVFVCRSVQVAITYKAALLCRGICNLVSLGRWLAEQTLPMISFPLKIRYVSLLLLVGSCITLTSPTHFGTLTLCLQLFYPSAKGKDLWYDPVFRVETIDGRNVWCKRHYKVRNGETPGTFKFSVLDNGVTSNEFWTIVGAADDLSWVVFHYAGAAGAVGQRYLGGLLCTPTGELPPEEDLGHIYNVLRSAEIEPWELFVVDNDDQSPGALAAGAPPLDYFRKTASVIG
jgi:hypothetical protein